MPSLPREFLFTLLLFIGVSLLVSCSAVKTARVHGVLHGEQVWQGQVMIVGDVVLEEDVRLTIKPGTRISFQSIQNAENNLTEHPNFPGSELIIKGTVTAVGTPESPIVFEAAERDAAAGAWGAVNLEGSPKAIFEYCIFRQADSAVHSRDSKVYIEQSVFENNLVGVRFNESQILVEHNLLRNNDTAIRFHLGSPVICENEFVDNAVNLFVTSHPRDFRIENNTFGIPGEYHVVFGEEVPEDMPLARNFWRYPKEASLDDLLYDGRRSDYLGRALLEPQRSTPAEKAGISWSP